MFIPGMKKTRKRVGNPVEGIIPQISIIADLVTEELTLLHDVNYSSESIVKESSRHSFTVAVLATMTMVAIVVFTKKK
jgi:hypothetical protein